MRLRYLVIPLMLSLMLGMPNATYLAIQGPVNGTLHNNATIFLGKVGAGESFYVLASAATTNAEGSYVNIGWDTLKVINPPQGWSVQPSPLYQNPMKMKVTVAPDAPDGIYSLTLRAINLQNYSSVGNITVTAYVNVTPDVYTLSIAPKTVSVGPGQPANLYITINNTGISDDPFVINAQGLPAWNVSDEVIALHSTTSTFTYPVFVNEPGKYTFNLTVASTTSQQLTKQQPITLTANASLLNDFSAVGQGVIISPVIMEPAYSFMLFLSYLYKLVAG